MSNKLDLLIETHDSEVTISGEKWDAIVEYQTLKRPTSMSVVSTISSG